jgi:prepilin signal peptidase PulO-like enzyme (type II secretory pathway)
MRERSWVFRRSIVDQAHLRADLCVDRTPAEFFIIDAYSIAWVALGAVIGAVLGSFINCARYRLPRGISMRQPAYSYCASCGSRLTAVDLVPILSWLFLGGRCRHCRAPIGIGTLVVELCCAAVGAVLVFWLVVEH